MVAHVCRVVRPMPTVCVGPAGRGHGRLCLGHHGSWPTHQYILMSMLGGSRIAVWRRADDFARCQGAWCGLVGCGVRVEGCWHGWVSPGRVWSCTGVCRLIVTRAVMPPRPHSVAEMSIAWANPAPRGPVPLLPSPTARGAWGDLSSANRFSPSRITPTSEMSDGSVVAFAAPSEAP